jgi:hypothetical protein
MDTTSTSVDADADDDAVAHAGTDAWAGTGDESTADADAHADVEAGADPYDGGEADDGHHNAFPGSLEGSDERVMLHAAGAGPGAAASASATALAWALAPSLAELARGGSGSGGGRAGAEDGAGGWGCSGVAQGSPGGRGGDAAGRCAHVVTPPFPHSPPASSSVCQRGVAWRALRSGSATRGRICALVPPPCTACVCVCVLHSPGTPEPHADRGLLASPWPRGSAPRMTLPPELPTAAHLAGDAHSHGSPRSLSARSRAGSTHVGRAGRWGSGYSGPGPAPAPAGGSVTGAPGTPRGVHTGAPGVPAPSALASLRSPSPFAGVFATVGVCVRARVGRCLQPCGHPTSLAPPPLRMCNMPPPLFSSPSPITAPGDAHAAPPSTDRAQRDWVKRWSSATPSPDPAGPPAFPDGSRAPVVSPARTPHPRPCV